jgi:hypothetical protein
MDRAQFESRPGYRLYPDRYFAWFLSVRYDECREPELRSGHTLISLFTVTQSCDAIQPDLQTASFNKTEESLIMLEEWFNCNHMDE